MINFTNTYEQLPENFYELTHLKKFKNPELIIFNEALANELELYLKTQRKRNSPEFSGQEILPGSNPLAMAYAGFQFGHPVPQLGDGRALTRRNKRKGYSASERKWKNTVLKTGRWEKRFRAHRY